MNIRALSIYTGLLKIHLGSFFAAYQQVATQKIFFPFFPFVFLDRTHGT